MGCYPRSQRAASHTSHKSLDIMKEITLRIPDDMVTLVEQLVTHMPEVELVCNKDCPIEYDGLGDLDRRVSLALQVLETNDVLRNPFDYTWIMVAINEGVVPDLTAFSSPKKFLDYLSLVGVKNIPCRSTISAWNCKVVGKFPDWVFTDTDGRTEKLRRINVVRQFLSALKSIK